MSFKWIVFKVFLFQFWHLVTWGFKMCSISLEDNIIA
jgi:hypothetical protein